VTIAADLGRSQSAIYTRIRHLERRITEAWGWPIQRVAQTTGIVEHTRRFIAAMEEVLCAAR